MLMGDAAETPEADLVFVTPDSRTRCIWVITSLTGSTGGLQEMKTTVIDQPPSICHRTTSYIPHGVFVTQLAANPISADGEKLHKETYRTLFLSWAAS